jgi:hypothetical protein
LHQGDSAVRLRGRQFYVFRLGGCGSGDSKHKGHSQNGGETLFFHFRFLLVILRYSDNPAQKGDTPISARIGKNAG